MSQPYSKAPAPTVIKFIAQFLGGDPQIFNKFLVESFLCCIQRCDEANQFLEIDGFTCPGGETIGPQVEIEPVPKQNGAKSPPAVNRTQ